MTDLRDYEERIVRNVEEFGCHVTTVFDPNGEEPSFSYSAGFPETVGQGEVIIFGLDGELMHEMINLLHKQCAEGLRLADNVRVNGLLEGFEVVAREIPQHRIDREHFNSARWLHRRTFNTELSSAYQLVWPGAADGLFPWDYGADEFVCSLQPPLYGSASIQ